MFKKIIILNELSIPNFCFYIIFECKNNIILLYNYHSLQIVLNYEVLTLNS